jgi:ADP-ribosylglycohydrolase
MHGPLLGDILGSTHEHSATKHIDFPLCPPGSSFTDDSVLTVATAHAILTDGDFAAAYRTWARRYPHAGYGGTFRRWFRDDAAGPYNSWGNGSAMRVAPVGWAATTDAECLEMARDSAAVTHDHPHGIAGAQAVALAVFRLRHGATKSALRD